MTPAPALVLDALHHVRKSAADTVAFCDAVLLGRRMDADIALSRLPAALRLLMTHTQRALDALEQEGTP